MRWRIPLVIILALFVAASCDQQPVEPQPTPDAPLLSAEVAHYSGAFTNEFDFLIPCGGVDELGHFVIDGKWKCTATTDAAGGEHFRWNLVTNGYGLGEFGSEWTIHETDPFQVYTPAGSLEDRVYNEHVTSMWVGKGHAPSWNDWHNWKWTMNASGDVTVDRYTHRTDCPEGSS